MLQKVCVVGVGAIGGWMGAKLAQLPGVQLSGLARGNTLAALQSQPLQLHSPAGNLQAAMHATDNPDELGPQDLVILAVRPPAWRAWRPRWRPCWGRKRWFIPP